MVDGRGFAKSKDACKHGFPVSCVRPAVAVRHVTWFGSQGALLAVLLGSSACSPAAFAVRERAAERALAAADAEGAQDFAVYERVLASRYLDKAREESAEAHYAWALSLLAQSEQSSLRARKLASQGARALTRSETAP